MLEKFVFFSMLIASNALDNCADGECVLNQHGRIMGGDITKRNSRPFQPYAFEDTIDVIEYSAEVQRFRHNDPIVGKSKVALYLRVGTTGKLGFCGGSLVHREWVLTAAHCCFHEDHQVDHVQAIIGAHSLYDRYENGRRVVNVDEIVVHPDWDASTFSSDLALMRLANIIQITDTIDTIRLPYLSISSYNFAGMGAIASGWGIAAEGVTFVSPTLREKLMTVMTDPVCNSSYYNQLPENTVCGFSVAAGICKGDNGGPLTIFHNTTEEVILIGVASFVGAGGCSDDLPSVFTRVQRYLPWISEVTGITLE